MQLKLLKLLILMAALTEFVLGPAFIFGAPLVKDIGFLNSVGIGQPVIIQVLGLFLLGFGALLYLSLKDIDRYVPFLVMDALAHLGIGLVDGYNLYAYEASSVLITLALWGSLVADTLWGLMVLFLLQSLGFLSKAK